MKKIKPKVKSLGLSKGFETINYSCGCSYSGEKIDGFFAGFMECKWCDGTSYKGQYSCHSSTDVNGCNGFGRFTFANGDWYEGMWVDNLANGQGVFYFKSKDIYWRGLFIDGDPEALGTYFKKNKITGEEHILYKAHGVNRILFEENSFDWESSKCKRDEQEDFLAAHWRGYDEESEDHPGGSNE